MAQTDDDAEILCVMSPSAPRRVMGTGLLAALAFLLLVLALRLPFDAFGWALFLIALGLAALWVAWRLWSGTRTGLILTAQTLHSTSGEVLARVDDIRSIERGALAMKPAGGFTLVTRTPGTRAWRPGLWWRAGRRIGVGGVVNRHEGRFMAEMIAGILSARDPDA